MATELIALAQDLSSRFKFPFRVTDIPDQVLFTSLAGRDYRLNLTVSPGRFRDLGVVDLTLCAIDTDQKHVWSGLMLKNLIPADSIASVVNRFEEEPALKHPLPRL